MKRIKIAMAAFIVTAGLVLSFAFTSKPVHIVFKAYTSTSDVIAASGTDHIIASQLRNISNWVDSTGVGLHSNSNKLKMIVYDQQQLADQDAFDATADYFTANSSSLPSDGNIFQEDVTGSNFTVTVYRKP